MPEATTAFAALLQWLASPKGRHVADYLLSIASVIEVPSMSSVRLIAQCYTKDGILGPAEHLSPTSSSLPMNTSLLDVPSMSAMAYFSERRTGSG